ncbi:hypothetical protein, partial [Capnocytophaga canis]|uniref:hypothetical protein n=1 Tax=Capnocytophaga canis TaxID=1848903 RepID=UPI001BB415BE
MNAIQNYVWGLSKPQQYEETIIEITTTQPNRTFEWYSVTGPVQYYDWNGTRTNSKAHTFASAGVYTIKIVGNINHFQTNKATTPDYFVTKVIQVASTITKFLYSFQNCRNLTSIPSGLFDKNVNATYFSSCFHSCTGLTS